MSSGSALPDEGASSDQRSVLAALNALVKRWRLVLGVPFSVALATALMTLLIPPTFTATVSFVPETRQSMRLPASIQGLAGQLGIPTGSEPSESPRFYSALLGSREVLERVLLDSYPRPGGLRQPGDSTTLLRVLKVGGRVRADSLERGVKQLRQQIGIRSDVQTSIVVLTVDNRYPDLAAAVANRFIHFLNAFNTETRQSRARERRRFVEARAGDAARALRATEEEVKTFYQRNRTWEGSPQLAFEEARLRRQVEIRQQVYLTLEREYETARIDEVNDTPVITVVESAVAPRLKSGPKRVRLVLLAAFLSFLGAVFLAFAAEYVHGLRRSDALVYDELTTRLMKIPGDVRRMFARTG